MKPGEKVGPFEIEKKIGSGAMGAVYRAKYKKTGQNVAIKVMIAGSLGNETAMARFEREAEVLKQLNHRNIVRFYVASQYQGAPYYAMEYVEGEPLDKLMQRRGRITWEETVEVGSQICAALQHAHDQGILHRDLKPSNLMLTPEGILKLTDFGIAKDLDMTQLTSANSTVGTAAYMSPEQCKGERNLTLKSDLYSLGVVLYELVTGRKPFQAETTMDMFLQHVQGEFERPARLVLEIPVWLDTLICQLLEKKPERRPFDAATVARSLDQVAEKVAALQSAGVDAVKARRADRSVAPRPTVDDADRKAARSLLISMRRTGKKRKRKSFFEKPWFQGLAILTFLTGVVLILIKVFQPSTPEQLYQRIQTRLETARDLDERLDVRDSLMKDYLSRFGDRVDASTKWVQENADELDVSRRWRAVKKHGGRIVGEGNAELAALAGGAAKAESGGDLPKANSIWEHLAQPSDTDDEDARVWRLLAAWRLKVHTTVSKIERDLEDKLLAAQRRVQVLELENPDERLVVQGLTFESRNDLASAQSAWEELKSRNEDRVDQRGEIWVLLAEKHLKAKKLNADTDKEVINR